jgi:hypothetical protein
MLGNTPESTIRTLQQEGWAGLKNGELLKRAKAAGFEALLTADQNSNSSRILRTPASLSSSSSLSATPSKICFQLLGFGNAD